jgi:hypothetical protein
MSPEEKLRRAVAQEGPRLSYDRAKTAGGLTHSEPFGEYTLTVQGGLGSMAVGTSAELRDKAGALLADYYLIESWVYLGRERAIKNARAWAKWAAEHIAAGLSTADCHFPGGPADAL